MPLQDPQNSSPDPRADDDQLQEAARTSSFTLDQLEGIWLELEVLARSVRRSRNQFGQSYRTSDVLGSAMRRLSADASRLASNGEELTFETRGVFFAAAATAMHRAIVDHIKFRIAEKRPTGGSRTRLPLDDAMHLVREDPAVLIDLDNCLAKLRATHPSLADLMEAHLFLPVSTFEDLGGLFGMPSSTVSDRIGKARAFLARCLEIKDR